jgi:hypothetical protein
MQKQPVKIAKSRPIHKGKSIDLSLLSEFHGATLLTSDWTIFGQHPEYLNWEKHIKHLHSRQAAINH